MKLKEVYDLIDGVILVDIPEIKSISYANYGLPEPPKEILEREIKTIEPFHFTKGLYKFGVIIRLLEKEQKEVNKL